MTREEREQALAWFKNRPITMSGAKKMYDLAISALEQPEPCEDTISRQAAIDAIGEKSDEIFKTKQKGATYPHDDFFQGMAYAENVVRQLPPAQPEPCEDAVSRKAVKDGFVEMCNLICPYTEKQRYAMCGSCLLGTAFDVLEATQPVTPKQHTGHWQITDAYPHNVYCSECHKRFAQTHWEVWEDGSLPRNFCPNCGAKMMEGDAE